MKSRLMQAFAAQLEKVSRREVQGDKAKPKLDEPLSETISKLLQRGRKKTRRSRTRES